VDLTHSFTVPASLAETWDAFKDIEDIAECFPGAAVTSVEGDEFKGTVKVKLGPIALQYAGTGAFVDRDESAHTFVVEAKGKDKRGNGTAAATVTAVMTPVSDDSTSVEVKTDLSITGKPAQFGRGVIQDVSDKLLQQFIDCLEGKVGAPAEAEAAEAEAAPAEEAAPAAVAAPAPEAAAAPAAGKRKVEQVEAIDLGATVLPIVLKTYWKQIAAAVVVLIILKKLLGRRRR
jgi:carbon monoxide dehydrogenase subunit G